MPALRRPLKIANLLRRPRRLASGVEAVYWYYRHPQTRKETCFGTDRAAADKAATLLNSKLADDPILELVSKVETTRQQFRKHLEWWINEHLPERRHKSGAKLSAGTLENYRLRAMKLDEKFGARYTDDIGTRELVEFFDQFPPETSNRYRNDCQQIFPHAVARGLRADNPALVTIKKDVVVQRQRLTLEAYNAIHARAPDWLQRAMALQLRSLQRPGDLCRIRREQWCPETKVLTIRQSKVPSIRARTLAPMA